MIDYVSIVTVDTSLRCVVAWTVRGMHFVSFRSHTVYSTVRTYSIGGRGLTTTITIETP